MRTKLSLAGPLLLLMVGSCKPTSTDTAAMPAPPTVQTNTGSITGGPPAAIPASCSDDLQCPAKAVCVDGRCAPIHAGMAAFSLVRVHFDLESAELRSAEYHRLNRMARCLKAEPAMKIDVRGSADERGPEDYNLALSEKRARVVALYLEKQGVSESQLNTVSYGEERPLCTEHNEACWQRNRRTGLAPK